MRLSPTRNRAHFGGLALVFSVAVPESTGAQNSSRSTVSRDSVTVSASDEFAAGGFHRFLLGDTYRDLWATPLRAPVLDLRSFAGGLKPTKSGGGKQTTSLRFVAPDGAEYVFRSVEKQVLTLPKYFDGTIVKDIVMDARSAAHPTAPIAAPAFLKAAGLLHPSPRLYVMPDDPALGEFRKDFANLLGTIEEYPAKPEQGAAFAGVSAMIDSDVLLALINADPRQIVDARTLLTARLVDMLLGDNDRHAGQWKWARLRPGGDWTPIPRDRDKVFLSYEGFLMKLGRMRMPSLVKFDSTYSPVEGLFENAIDFDRRMLSGLDRLQWDQAATRLTQAITDDVINTSMAAMPAEYAASIPELSAKLRERRRGLRAEALDYYDELAETVDIHGTDADDRATIVRSRDGFVEVRLMSAAGAPYFSRRFNPEETKEIRVYLHDGNDNAVVSGEADRSVKVRVIGGNGTNTLIDSSIVGGDRNTARLYDEGSVQGIYEGQDSASKARSDDNPAYLPFDKRPWVAAYGDFVPPSRDHGVTITPIAGLRTGHGLGLVPRIGLVRYAYGFNRVPYASMLAADVAYSTAVQGFEVRMRGDKRFQSSSLHLPFTAGMSQLEVVEFRGFGNDVPDLRGDFYDVRQRQYSFFPAAARSLGPKSDVSLGPIVRYTTTDSAANRFISEQRPYGFGEFGQTGVRLKLAYDTRFDQTGSAAEADAPFSTEENPPVWGWLDLTGSLYPAMWDAESAYRDVSGTAAGYLTIPVFTRPVLALRAGGKKLFGDFPYFDAAFIGGGGSLRTEYRQRYAGDASLFGTAELRVPIAKFAFVLPLDVGALGFVDMARVYVDGESRGGWHRGTGAGFWVGVVNPATNVNVTYTNHPDRKVQVSLGFAF